MTPIPFTFDCMGSPLLGIIHKSENPTPIGVLIVVGGGPQYRAGGHRQLLLWSRRIAEEGYSVMRFDYRGMGDSGGTFSGFEDIEADIDAALTAFSEKCPEISKFVLWGECDASSAIMMYAAKDPRIVGISLQNPWARSESGEAKTVLKHYYLKRFLQPSFWKKVFSFKFDLLAALSSIKDLLLKARGDTGGTSTNDADEGLDQTAREQLPYPVRMKNGLQRYTGKVLLFMSGRDLIAREFDELAKSDKEWSELIKSDQCTRVDIKMGDHTFSSEALRNEVVEHGITWLKAL